MLTILNALPEGFLEVPLDDLHTLFSGPTLLHLPGRRPEPLFVAVLLHGNEPSGFLALQRFLRVMENRPLPRALSIFIGNIAAVRENVRSLNGQPDYNRIWCPGPLPEHQMAHQVMAEMVRKGVFASIDFHNNTANNPHYGCTSHLDNASLNLAYLFSRDMVFFQQPETVLSNAFAELCPSVTVECGPADAIDGIKRARAYLERCIHLEHIPETPLTSDQINLYRTVAVMYIKPGIPFGFGAGNGTIRFDPDLDRLNFQELPTGFRLADLSLIEQPALVVLDNQKKPVFDDYFTQKNGHLLTRQPVIPAMMTTNHDNIRKDCLGYIMERMWPDQMTEDGGRRTENDGLGIKRTKTVKCR